jgi:hypothetical protein
MLRFIAGQISTPSDALSLKDFLQYGQMGLALATLIVGAMLFTTAIKQHNLNQGTVAILKFFAKIMVALFVVSFLGEMVTKIMDFYMKLHPPDPHVNVTIAMPPLNLDNYKDYGPIIIKPVDSSGTEHPTPVPANEPQTFFVHNGTTFHIDLYTLTTLLSQARQQANLSHKETTTPDQTVGQVK